MITLDEDSHNHNGHLELSPSIILSSSRPGSPPPGSKSSASIGLQVQVPPGLSKYTQLLSVIEEMGRDIRPTYAGSRSSVERLKRGIVHARILVRECLLETERSERAAAAAQQ